MASLNLSTNGGPISKSYQAVVDGPLPSGSEAASPTYGQWAVFSVSAPLANAFQDSGNKESVLKVQSTGKGELAELVEEFSDGRIQYAYVKIRDSNTGLPKSALIAWCGEGVPERTKGYFTSHTAAVAKLLHGYHVQITARSDRDLTPDSIVQKVADASGSKYSTSSAPPPVAAATKPAVASKAVFTATPSSSVGGFNPLARPAAKKLDADVDEDGWGADAPPVTRTQLEKVEPAYKPTKVDMRTLTSQKPAAPADTDDRPGVVKGAYQPVGKVDIAEIRRKAREAGQLKDDRPEIVKGSYEPVGKVDISAIRARAQKPDDASIPSQSQPVSIADEATEPPTVSLTDRSAPFSHEPERLTSLPKPKVAHKFGGSSTFTGTKAPVPGGFESKAPVAAPIGAPSRSFADSAGKTPAQLWAEKKARERGVSESGDAVLESGVASPLQAHTSGGAQWESGYTGKKWATVQTTRTGQSHTSSLGQQPTGEQQETPASPVGGVSSIRDRFSGAPPMGAPAPSFDRAPPPAPEPEAATKPNRGIPIQGLSATQEPEASSLPPQPRSPTPPTGAESPIQVAIPVGRDADIQDAHQEHLSPPALPVASLQRAVPQPEPEADEPETSPDRGRGAAVAAASNALAAQAVAAAPPANAVADSGVKARAEYDYEAAEDNEVSLREGEIVTDIQKVDPDWWLVKNEDGETGLVPSNYLQELEDEPASGGAAAAAPVLATPSAPAANVEPEAKAVSATALYDYEAGEDNELSFPENAVITNISFPDEDWWHGEYGGRAGLFPANYTKLHE
ncbi:hypothetical protein DV736_g3973, partial [Chaetothyriales sp. CBS 134916]